jgi:hypothetical protein
MCISCALAGFPEQIVGLVVFSAQIFPVAASAAGFASTKQLTRIQPV